jgi:hypothetical protein
VTCSSPSLALPKRGKFFLFSIRFGTNNLTGGQKSNLIFGGLLLGFIVFMSGYLLE